LTTANSRIRQTVIHSTSTTLQTGRGSSPAKCAVLVYAPRGANRQFRFESRLTEMLVVDDALAPSSRPLEELILPHHRSQPTRQDESASQSGAKRNAAFHAPWQKHTRSPLAQWTAPCTDDGGGLHETVCMDSYGSGRGH
jgi:hypothetical protein